jgi:hypothetical protein
MMRLALVGLFALLLSAQALAIFARVPAARVDEVPVERLLTNLERNVQRLPDAELARAIGRVHLLAYLRTAVTLPVYRTDRDRIAEGLIWNCVELDAKQQGFQVPQNVPPESLRERCETASYSLAPPREIPREPHSDSLAPDAHLAAATTAYTRARTLDPSNLRTRVALAFAYDRGGRRPLALEELRLVAREGLRRISPERSGSASSDWETHVVVSEAVEHLELIATSSSDQRLVAQVKARLAAAPPSISITPILVPLRAQETVEDLVDRASRVTFDFSGQGMRLQAGWLTENAAWLVWDPSHRRRVISGFQLFGSVTWITFWETGYRALGTLDDNGDGRIAGAELNGLALWHDRNADGVCDEGEVEPVAAHGIVALGYAHARLNDDFWVSPAGVTFENGEAWPTYDWLLKPRPSRQLTH